MKKKILSLLLVSEMALSMVACGSQPKDLSDSKANIEDFEYDISKNHISLKEYNGDLKILYIQPNYEVDGKIYKTVLTDLWIDNNVNFVIFGNGIRDVNPSIFNSSEVEKVYFPKTMQVVYDKTLNYLHPDDGEKIQVYYEGTEEEWNSIFSSYERQTVKEAWNSSEDAEEKGEAVGKSIADKLNGMMGSYDPSEFEYHYSVSKDSLEELIK